MNIKFRQGSESVPERSIARAQTKLLKLSKLIAERNYEAEVYVDTERESGSHNSERLWRASIHLDLAGDRLNAVAMGNTIDKAIDLAIKELKHELKRANEKRGSLRKRGGGLLKRLQQRFS